MPRRPRPYNAAKAMAEMERHRPRWQPFVRPCDDILYSAKMTAPSTYTRIKAAAEIRAAILDSAPPAIRFAVYQHGYRVLQQWEQARRNGRRAQARILASATPEITGADFA